MRKEFVLLLIVGILIVGFVGAGGGESENTSENKLIRLGGESNVSDIQPTGPDVGYCQPSYCDSNNYESNEGTGGIYCCSNQGGSSGFEECTDYKTKSTVYIYDIWTGYLADSEADYCSNSYTLQEAYMDCQWLSNDRILFTAKNCNDYDGDGGWYYYCTSNQVRKKERDYGCDDGECKIIGWKNDQLVSQKGYSDYCTKRKEGVDKGWSGCTLCTRGEYDCNYDSECASGLECLGPWGGALDGCCYPADWWDETNYRCCECSSGPCCDGCHYISSSYVCDSHVSGTDQYRCTGNCLDEDVLKRYQKQYCSGTSSSCTGSKEWTGGVNILNCNSAQFCQGSTSWSSSSRTCSSAQCTSGVCCDTTCGIYSYKSSSTVCSDSTEYGCPWGVDLGNDAGKRDVTQKCSGSSSSCSGQTTYSGWIVNDDCTNEEYCDGGWCVGIACSEDADCGTDYWYGEKCDNNDVYGNFVDYSCTNPGTKSSQCTNSETYNKKDECGESEDKNICWFYDRFGNYYDKGYVVEEHTERFCNTNTVSCDDWGTMDWIKQCQTGCTNGNCNEDVCTDECVLPGETRCSENYRETCGNYDTDSCLEWGYSLNCGIDSCDFFGENYCKNDDVYHSRTCNDKGCSSGHCFDNPYTDEQLVQDCTSGCSAGSCISAGDLIAHWGFEDNIQDSADSHHGTNYGAGFVAGKSGNAINFDGINDYVSVPDNADLNAKTARSITAWIKRDRIGEGDDIVIKRGNSNSGWGFAVSSDNKLKFTFFGVKDIYSTGVITDTNWHHVAVTIDASGNVKFYIDGNAAGTGSVNPALIKTTTQPLRMAVYVDSNGIIGSKKDFILDELKIWNKALTSGEVLAEYNSYGSIVCSSNADCGTDGFVEEKYCAGIGLKDVYQNYQTFTCENPGTISSSCSLIIGPQLIEECLYGCSNGECIDITGLIAHWKFEDNIQDSADSHHGTNYGSAFVAGKSGNAINFDGINDYVSVPDNVDIRAKVPRTVETWIKRDQTGEVDEIAAKRGNSNSGWGFAVSSDNKLKFTFFGVKDLYSTGTIIDTNWHHIAVTIDASGNVKFYIDGNNAGTDNVNPALIKTTTQPLRMAVYVAVNGVPDISRFRDFVLDELKIWNRVLSQDEIKAQM